MKQIFDFFCDNGDTNWTDYVQYDLAPTSTSKRRKMNGHKINGHKKEKGGGRKPPNAVEVFLLMVFFVFLAWLILG